MAPRDVGPAVTIEVANPGHPPGRAGNRGEREGRPAKRGSGGRHGADRQSPGHFGGGNAETAAGSSPRAHAPDSSRSPHHSHLVPATGDGYSPLMAASRTLPPPRILTLRRAVVTALFAAAILTGPLLVVFFVFVRHLTQSTSIEHYQPNIS